MRQCSFSPKPRYVPYGTQSATSVSPYGALTAQSGASYGVVPPYAPTLAEYRQQLSEQVLAAKDPLTAKVAQTSQTVQQTGALVGHVLEAAQQAKESIEQLKQQVSDVLKAYTQQTEQSMQQQLSTTAEALVKKIALSSSTVEETVQQEHL